MYYKRPYLDHFELVIVTRAYVLQKMPNGDLEVRLELGDGITLNRVYTLAEYGELITNPPRVIV